MPVQPEPVPAEAVHYSCGAATDLIKTRGVSASCFLLYILWNKFLIGESPQSALVIRRTEH